MLNHSPLDLNRNRGAGHIVEVIAEYGRAHDKLMQKEGIGTDTLGKWIPMLRKLGKIKPCCIEGDHPQQQSYTLTQSAMLDLFLFKREYVETNFTEIARKFVPIWKNERVPVLWIELATTVGLEDYIQRLLKSMLRGLVYFGDVICLYGKSFSALITELETLFGGHTNFVHEGHISSQILNLSFYGEWLQLYKPHSERALRIIKDDPQTSRLMSKLQEMYESYGATMGHTPEILNNFLTSISYKISHYNL